MTQIDLLHDLFMCPIIFDGEETDENGVPTALAQEDNELHVTAPAYAMIEQGSKLALIEDLPEKLVLSEKADKGLIHYRKINTPDGRAFIPLFVSYKNMTKIYGEKNHIGIVCYDEVKKICEAESDIAGIVIEPGCTNKVIMRDKLI